MLAANVANARRLGLHVAPLDTLERLRDIDTVEDLRCWCACQHRRGHQQVVSAGHRVSEADDMQGSQAELQPGSMQALLEAAFHIAARTPAQLPSCAR